MGSYVADSVVLNWPRILSFWFQHASSGQVIQGRITVIPSGIVTEIVTSPQQPVTVHLTRGRNFPGLAISRSK